MRKGKRKAESEKRSPSFFGLWAVGGGLFLASLSVLAQTSPPPAVAPAPAPVPMVGQRIFTQGGGTIILQGGNLIIRGNPAVPGQLDPQAAAAMQQMGVDPNATATVEFDPPVITVGQRATYRVNVTASIEGASVPDEPPTPPGLKLAFAGRGFSYGAGGFGLQPRTSFDYRVGVTAPGEYVVTSYTGSANGKPLKVPEAHLTVLPAGVPGARLATAQLLLEVTNTECYIGQALTVRLTMLDPGNNSVQAITQPQLSGEAFIFENWAAGYRREMRPMNGHSLAANICEVFAYPLKEGQLQLSAVAYAHVQPMPVNPAAPQPAAAVLMDSDPIPVTVKHLPTDGELAGFTGGIGVFQIESAKLSTNVVRAGEPLTLTVTIKGEGNLPRLVAPPVGRPQGWQTFPPVPDGSVAQQIEMRGSIIFTYTLLPLNERLQTTPAIPFSYFDLAKKAYADLTIPAVAIKVLPPLGGTPPSAEPVKTATVSIDDPDHPTTANDPVLTGLIGSPGRTGSSLVPLQQQPWFLVLQLAPAALLGGLWLRERRRRFLELHPEVVLRARARRGLRRQLRLARHAAAARDTRGFVTATVNAMREACAPRAAANPAALVCADVLEALAPAERDHAEGQLVRTLFGVADADRFEDLAPDGTRVLALQPQIETLLEKWRARL